MSKKRKKSTKKGEPTIIPKLAFITALIGLLRELIELIAKLIE